MANLENPAYRTTVIFLRLSVEKLRSTHPLLAQILRMRYVEPTEHILSLAEDLERQNGLSSLANGTEQVVRYELLRYLDGGYGNFLPQAVGLELEPLSEVPCRLQAHPEHVETSNSAANMVPKPHENQPNGSPSAENDRDSSLFQLVKHSQPLDRNKIPPLGTCRPIARPMSAKAEKDGPAQSHGHLKKGETNAEKFQKSPARKLRNSESGLTWAKIVAGQGVSQAAERPCENRASHSASASSEMAPPQDFIPCELLADKMRLIWITQLPRQFDLRGMGSILKHGLIMSINIGDDLDPILPGRSASIVFRYATDALFFYDHNKACAGGDFREPERKVHAKIPTEIIVGGLLEFVAPEALILPPAPFSLNEDLLSMDSPRFARRRLRWSLDRLFNSVPTAVFQQEVLSLVGNDNLEKLFVSNSGRATATFANVRIATLVKKWFDTRKYASSGPNHGKYDGAGCRFVRAFEDQNIHERQGSGSTWNGT